MLKQNFFARNALTVAKDLLGKVLMVRYQDCWLRAMVIETEAYFLTDKGSHASLGYTEKRQALFMPAGTIYMYYARGGDSLNVSCQGDGNAVLIKSAWPYLSTDDAANQRMLQIMQQLNPHKNHAEPRPMAKLCNGQTLLCRSLSLRVPDWDQRQFSADRFYIDCVDYQPSQIIQTKRLGIPPGRDEHLPYRFIDYSKAAYCTKNPLRRRRHANQQDYVILLNKSAATV